MNIKHLKWNFQQDYICRIYSNKSGNAYNNKLYNNKVNLFKQIISPSNISEDAKSHCYGM